MASHINKITTATDVSRGIECAFTLAQSANAFQQNLRAIRQGALDRDEPRTQVSLDFALLGGCSKLEPG